MGFSDHARRRGVRLCLVGLGVFGATGLGGTMPAQTGVVYVIPVTGMIDLGIAPFVQRVLSQAKAEGAAAVILDINTFGGRVDAAVAIRDALLSAEVLTVAFINRRAISAGALISLAAERIVVTDGSTIGAATPVQAGQPGAPAAPVEEKAVSYVRKEFRATAETRKRPTLVAEAMVDSDVEIPGLIAKGKLLTLTTEEALAHGVADFRANSIASLLEQLELPGAEVRRASVNWAERVVRLLTHPVVSSLLLSLGMLGILLEIRTPGFGLPGAIGVASLALFLGGHWIVQLAGWEELLLVGLGVVLVAVEVFVLPGFGIAGAAGIGALLVGFTMSLMGAGAAPVFIAQAIGRVLLSMVVALVAGLALMRLLPRLPWGRRLVLDTGLETSQGYVSAPDTDTRWLGKSGRAHSILRPAGIADIGGERVDVVSDGEMIEAGAEIIVSRIDGNRIVVRRRRTINQGAER
jgi:membrane-bound serine protease (ClpP class)